MIVFALYKKQEARWKEKKSDFILLVGGLCFLVGFFSPEKYFGKKANRE